MLYSVGQDYNEQYLQQLTDLEFMPVKAPQRAKKSLIQRLVSNGYFPAS